jgi:cysteine desulfurase
VIYLDNAASTPLRPEAIVALTAAMTGPYGNPTGLHAAARAAKRELEAARELVAADLGAAPNEIVFTGGGSEADNLAIKGVVHAVQASGVGRLGAPMPAGRLRVVTTGIEHKAVLAAAHRLETQGVEVVVVDSLPNGLVDLDAFTAALNENTVLASVMTVNNEVGTVLPIADIAALMRTHAPQAYLHTDAVQAAPWIDVASATSAADLVAISGHKFGGPKGVGVLVVRHGVPIQPIIEGGGHEWGMRAGTQNVPGIVALAAALQATVAGRANETARIGTQRDRLEVTLVRRIPGLRVNGVDAPRTAGHLHVTVPGVEAEALLVALDHVGVCAAAGSSCSSGAIDPSPALLAMGMPRDEALRSIRLSLGVSTTDDEITAAGDLIVECVEKLQAAAARANARH